MRKYISYYEKRQLIPKAQLRTPMSENLHAVCREVVTAPGVVKRLVLEKAGLGVCAAGSTALFCREFGAAGWMGAAEGCLDLVALPPGYSCSEASLTRDGVQ